MARVTRIGPIVLTVIDEQVDRRVFEDIGEPIDALLIGNIELHDLHLERIEIRCRLWPPGGPDHLPPRRAVLAGKLQTESTVGTGNEHRFGRALAIGVRVGLPVDSRYARQ
jgi:hypothetical protein